MIQLGTHSIASGGFGGFHSTNSETHDRAERLAAQTNIQSPTEQNLEKAVSPLTNLDALKKDTKSGAEAGATDKKADNPNELTEEEEKQVQELKQRDAEVRAHEQAHAAVGGSYASAPSYEFTTGPDNKQYATSGEVQIDSAPVPNNPEATIRKMDIVIRAALAPAEPSPQDIRVATNAQQQRTAAQAELAKQRLAEQKGDQEGDNPLQERITEKTSGDSTDSAGQTDPNKILEAILAYKAQTG